MYDYLIRCCCWHCAVVAFTFKEGGFEGEGVRGGFEVRVDLISVRLLRTSLIMLSAGLAFGFLAVSAFSRFSLVV